MRKTIIIFIFVIIVGIAAIVAYLLYTQNNETTDLSGATLPINSSSSSASGISSTPSDNYGLPPQGPQVTIQTSRGGIAMNNFYLGRQIATSAPAVMVTSTAAYDIWYSRSDGSFEIDLADSGPHPQSAPAEAAFLNALGIDAADACKLDVTVEGMTNDGDYMPVGGLSFCVAASSTFAQ